MIVICEFCGKEFQKRICIIKKPNIIIAVSPVRANTGNCLLSVFLRNVFSVAKNLVFMPVALNQKQKRAVNITFVQRNVPANLVELVI